MKVSLDAMNTARPIFFEVHGNGIPRGYSVVEFDDRSLVLVRKKDEDESLTRWAWKRDERTLIIAYGYLDAGKGDRLQRRIQIYRPRSRLLWIIERAWRFIEFRLFADATYHKEVLRLKAAVPLTWARLPDAARR